MILWEPDGEPTFVSPADRERLHAEQMERQRRVERQFDLVVRIGSGSVTMGCTVLLMCVSLLLGVVIGVCSRHG
jgi:hypothetical protein